jgi:hypothetical protein
LDPIQFRYALKYEEIREAYELAHHRSLRQGRWGGVLLILVGVVVPLVDWKDLSVIGFTMVLVGAYLLVRNSQDLRKWYEHKKIGTETYEAAIDDAGLHTQGPQSLLNTLGVISLVIELVRKRWFSSTPRAMWHCRSLNYLRKGSPT